MNSKYQEIVTPRLPELTALIDAGETDKSVAGILGISTSTLRRYRKTYPELAEIFERRKELCDDLVESALLRRATGYADASGKEIPPDVRAAVFWLQNRRPEKWQPKSNNAKSRKISFEIELNQDEAIL